MFISNDVRGECGKASRSVVKHQSIVQLIVSISLLRVIFARASQTWAGACLISLGGVLRWGGNSFGAGFWPRWGDRGGAVSGWGRFYPYHSMNLSTLLIFPNILNLKSFGNSYIPCL